MHHDHAYGVRCQGRDHSVSRCNAVVDAENDDEYRPPSSASRARDEPEHDELMGNEAAYDSEPTATQLRGLVVHATPATQPWDLTFLRSHGLRTHTGCMRTTTHTGR